MTSPGSRASLGLGSGCQDQGFDVYAEAACGFAFRYAVTGFVRILVTGKPGLPGPGFAFNYAVAVFVQTLSEQIVVGRPGLELADGSDMWSRPGIAGHRPLAGGGESPRPQGASNPGPPD